MQTNREKHGQQKIFQIRKCHSHQGSGHPAGQGAAGRPQPQNIPRDYEDYLFKLYQKRIKKFLEKEDINLRTLLLRTLVFISSHQRIFRALFIHKQEEFIKKIFRCLKNRILAEWHLAGDLNEFYYVYENEIIGVIEAWDKQNFTNHSLSSTLNNLTHLTNTAPRRLTFLIKTKDSE